MSTYNTRSSLSRKGRHLNASAQHLRPSIENRKRWRNVHVTHQKHTWHQSVRQWTLIALTHWLHPKRRHSGDRCRWDKVNQAAVTPSITYINPVCCSDGAALQSNTTNSEMIDLLFDFRCERTKFLKKFSRSDEATKSFAKLIFWSPFLKQQQCLPSPCPAALRTHRGVRDHAIAQSFRGYILSS